MSNKKRLICITGMDGTGKSTLVHALAERLAPCAISGIWDLVEEKTNLLFSSKRDVDNYLCTLTPDSRLLFLGHALKYSIDKALSDPSPVVLINAYVYKYFAVEMALGANMQLTHALVNLFPTPDLVIRLTLSPQEAAKRKGKFSRYETGLSENPSAEQFIAFQQQAAIAWNTFDQQNWRVLDAAASPAMLVEQALQLIPQQ